MALGEGENSAFVNESIETQSVRFGSTYHVNSILFVGGAFGSKTLKVKNQNDVTMDLKTTQTGFGIGIDVLTIGDGLSFTLEGWRYSGYGAAGEGQSFNVGSESYEYFLSIRWSPMVTVSAGR